MASKLLHILLHLFLVLQNCLPKNFLHFLEHCLWALQRLGKHPISRSPMVVPQNSTFLRLLQIFFLHLVQNLGIF